MSTVLVIDDGDNPTWDLQEWLSKKKVVPVVE